jgi:hypothetical protein
MESDSALKADKSARVGDNGFQTGKILALSITHFVHDVYSKRSSFHGSALLLYPLLS